MADVSVVRVAVLADTHLRPGRETALPPAVVAELTRADVILHAGDVLVSGALDHLRTFAPVHAVLGNNDVGLDHELPERLHVELGGVSVALVHDAGPGKGRPARLRRWFPAADLVVFGHSHEPVDEVGDDGQILFNPGSPTQRRRQPHRTMGVLELGGGRIRSRSIRPVDHG